MPEDRLAEVPCFENTALDVFGHFYVQNGRKTRNSYGSRKLWVLLFVCLTSRAVHVEFLPGMDTSTFRNALQRFIAFRGTPKIIRSDNGSNFVCSSTQMKDLSNSDESIDVGSIQNHLEKRGIQWIFNPGYSSHFGGNFERKIKSIRSCFQGCIAHLGQRMLTYDEFCTLMQEACSIVNNTPMTEVSNHPDDPMPITPSMLLNLKDSSQMSDIDEFDHKDLLAYGTKRWRRVQFLAQVFWRRWSAEYVLSLNRRHKWKVRKSCISVGDVVLVKDKTKRNCWPVGRVSNVRKSCDGLVRSVTIILPPLKGSSKKRTIERAIHNLVLLVKSNDHGTDCLS